MTSRQKPTSAATSRLKKLDDSGLCTIFPVLLSHLMLVLLTTTPLFLEDFDDLVLLLIKEDVDADAARVRAFNAAATFIVILVLL